MAAVHLSVRVVAPRLVVAVAVLEVAVHRAREEGPSQALAVVVVVVEVVVQGAYHRIPLLWLRVLSVMW